MLYLTMSVTERIIQIVIGGIIILVIRYMKTPNRFSSKQQEKEVWKLINTKGQFTRDNVWLLYRLDTFHFFHSYVTAHKLKYIATNSSERSITYAVANSNLNTNKPDTFTVSYTLETFALLAQLLNLQTLKQQYEKEVEVYIDLSFTPDIIKAHNEEKSIAKMGLIYIPKGEKLPDEIDEETTPITYINCTVGELKDSFYKTVEWKKPATVNS